VAALVLAAAPACVDFNNGPDCGPDVGAPGLPANECEIDCSQWVNQVRPFALGTDFLALAPDWSVSPPTADVKVGRRFRITTGVINTSPSGCNHGFDGPQSYRSTEPTVVAVVGPALFEGVAPGTTMVVVDGMRLPSGRTETVHLTVCSQPTPTGAAEVTCPTRVPLVIRVVP